MMDYFLIESVLRIDENAICAAPLQKTLNRTLRDAQGPALALRFRGFELFGKKTEQHRAFAVVLTARDERICLFLHLAEILSQFNGCTDAVLIDDLPTATIVTERAHHLDNQTESYDVGLQLATEAPEIVVTRILPRFHALRVLPSEEHRLGIRTERHQLWKHVPV